MSKIAVVIRGHLRTWNFTKQQLFQVIESRYPNVDWYFSTWEESVSPSRLDIIHQDFQARNWKLYITPGCANYSSWFGPGVLCEQVADDLMAEQYDLVIETRPDVYLNISPEKKLPSVVEKNSVYSTGLDLVYTLVPGYPKMDHHFGSEDWFFLFDQNAFYTYSQRRHRPGPQDSHGDIIRIAKENNFNLFHIRKFLNAILIRPNIFQNPFDYAWMWGHAGFWNTTPKEGKISLLNQHDIALDDYMTSNTLISL